MSNPNAIEKDVVRVAWVELGEGWNGDYNEEDPNDEELLRFDVYVRQDETNRDSLYEWSHEDEDGTIWLVPGDSSYCTRFPVKATPEQRLQGLEIIMNEVYEPCMNGYPIKKICERLSWIGLDWLEDKGLNDPRSAKKEDENAKAD